MPTTAMNDAYINALLADASYVNGLEEVNINSLLTTRLTKPLADFITNNFDVLSQTNSADGGFDAVVWKGQVGTPYEGKTYVSMRGTQEFPIDLLDDAQLATTGVAYSQIANMVNWWLRETTPAGQLAKQIGVFTIPVPGYPDVHHFVEAGSASGTGKLQNVTFIDSINGHSLGGYLATSFARLFGNQWPVSGLSTFNSAGFSNIQTANINIEFNTILGIIGNNLGFSGFLSGQQTNYYAENGINVTTNTWRPVGFNQIGQRVEIFQEDKSYVANGGVMNHFMYKLTDILALGDLIAKLDHNFTITQLNGYVKNASNIMDASYEKLLDGLRHTILGDVADTLIGDASSGATRTNYHENLKALNDSITALSLTGKFTLTAPPTSGSEARNDLGSFLSLYYLTPFALKPNGAGATDTLYQLHAAIADKWNDDRNLTEKQIANGAANFSDQYLADRAAMLKWVLKSNLDDTYGRAAGLEAIYEDKASGINLSPIIVSNTPMVKFGANDADAIGGSNKADDLYGGGGDDSINAGEGNDYLEGGAGADTLNGGKGNDTLLGGAGNDTLTGDAEVDILVGGDDYLNGGEGNYLRCAIKLLSASLMRVCQPCPSDLKYASTSASRRIPVYTLGKAALGRPGLRLVSNSFATSLPTKLANTSAAGLNCFKSCNVTSRTSPAALVNGLWIFISRYLSFVSTTQTNHPNTASNRGKTQHMQALNQITQSHQSLLWVRVTNINSNACSLPIKIDHFVKRQLTLSQVFSRLSCIEINNHGNYCIYNNYVCQTNVLPSKKVRWIEAANDNKWSLAA